MSPSRTRIVTPDGQTREGQVGWDDLWAYANPEAGDSEEVIQRGGTPTACSTLMAKDTCSAELGCVWVSQCTGTAKACETFSDDDCRYQPGCSCESCGTSSSSSSGESA